MRWDGMGLKERMDEWMDGCRNDDRNVRDGVQRSKETERMREERRGESMEREWMVNGREKERRKKEEV